MRYEFSELRVRFPIAGISFLTMSDCCSCRFHDGSPVRPSGAISCASASLNASNRVLAHRVGARLRRVKICRFDRTDIGDAALGPMMRGANARVMRQGPYTLDAITMSNSSSSYRSRADRNDASVVHQTIQTASRFGDGSHCRLRCPVVVTSSLTGVRSDGSSACQSESFRHGVNEIAVTGEAFGDLAADARTAPGDQYGFELGRRPWLRLVDECRKASDTHPPTSSSASWFCSPVRGFCSATVHGCTSGHQIPARRR